MDEIIQSSEPHKLLSFPSHAARNAKQQMTPPKEFDGPLSGPMWLRSTSLKSKFPDTFDYSIYDHLHFRFKNTPLRGGVVFKTGLKVVNDHPSCSLCHYAFEIDTYGRGCVFNCAYCYAKEQLTKRGYWNRPHPFPIDISEIKKIFATVFETNGYSKWREVLERKIPLRIGSMSDSFMWMDQKYRVSLELLKILKNYKYPYVVFTRSDLIASDEYLALVDPNLAQVQFSISGLSNELTRQLEPGAPSVQRRFDALQALARAGIKTAVRLNPLFPTFPDGYFTDREYVEQRFKGDRIPTFELFDIRTADVFMARLAEAGVSTLIAGFVRLSRNSIAGMRKATGIDLTPFFHPEANSTSAHKHFSDSEIAFYYKKLQWEAAKKGIRFSTCYIGNGTKDYYQYQQLWANKSDCCDARGRVKAISASSQDLVASPKLNQCSRPSEDRCTT